MLFMVNYNIVVMNNYGIALKTILVTGPPLGFYPVRFHLISKLFV